MICTRQHTHTHAQSTQTCKQMHGHGDAQPETDQGQSSSVLSLRFTATSPQQIIHAGKLRVPFKPLD